MTCDGRPSLPCQPGHSRVVSPGDDIRQGEDPGASTCSPVALGILTSRETEVLKLIAHGMSNAEISDTLAIAAERYLRMLTARATTRATVTIETLAWAVMPIFAHRDSGIVSVGLNAVALVKDRYR